MNLPEIPQKAKDYFWVLAMFAAFGLVQAISTRLSGSPSNAPAPPTIQVNPVVAVPEADGTMRILNLQPAQK